MLSVIIDDEQATRNLLAGMLKKYCPSVQLAGTASSADKGYKLIMEVKPDLVFLDIKMPGKTGFDLLRMFEAVQFNVIFVSAFDRYAIDAFEFSAVDYILKPIDHVKLVKAVNKAALHVKEKDYDNVLHFVHSMDEKTQLVKRISLHQQDKVHIIDIEDICFVQALSGYSEIVTAHNEKFVSSKPLTDYENLFRPFDHFIRVNKSIIINIHYIKHYSKGMDCVVTVKNSEIDIEVSRRKKNSILQYLKQRIKS